MVHEHMAVVAEGTRGIRRVEVEVLESSKEEDQPWSCDVDMLNDTCFCVVPAGRHKRVKSIFTSDGQYAYGIR